jgi:hypothetical protein
MAGFVKGRKWLSAMKPIEPSAKNENFLSGSSPGKGLDATETFDVDRIQLDIDGCRLSDYIMTSWEKQEYNYES